MTTCRPGKESGLDGLGEVLGAWAEAVDCSTTTLRQGARFTTSVTRSSFRWFGGEEVEPEPLGQVLRDELAAHAVSGGIERRREGRQAALAG